jgi:hypothetical protein
VLFEFGAFCESYLVNTTFRVKILLSELQLVRCTGPEAIVLFVLDRAANR